ncbi:MAG TPA: hypothetical protein VER96_03315 [Polyangiaceae bacterium]|nr:hypothetical protein [Polyangiaceae bacterium]
MGKIGMLGSVRVCLVSLLCAVLGTVTLACGTKGSADASAGHAGQSQGGSVAEGGSAVDTVAGTGGTAGAPREEGGSGGTGAGGMRDLGLLEPTVVYAQTGVLAGLALAGDALYASVAAGINVTPMTPGSIIRVPKDATGASPQAGASTVIADISPRALAVVDGQLYWDEGGLGSMGAVMTAPITGGTPQAVFDVSESTYVQTRLVIAGNLIHVMASGNLGSRVIKSAALGPAGTPTISLQFRGDHLKALEADDSNLFFLVDSGSSNALGYAQLDLAEVEPNTGGNGELRLLQAAAAVPIPDYTYLVSDASLLYWSDGQKISSFPKAPNATDVPTVVATLDTPTPLSTQLLIDGPNLYVLTANQLLRVKKTGGAPVLLAASPEGTFDQSPTNALGMVVDDDSIYFLDAGKGRILKLPK